MRVALAQLDSGSDRSANIEVIERDLADAARLGAEILLLPEACAFRGAFGPELPESDSGPALSAIRAAAAAHQVAVLVGGLWMHSGEAARPYNSAVFIDEAGQVLGTYRKVHLFRIDDGAVREDEAACTTAGDELVTVTWRDMVFGLSICYDLRFPELYRALAAAGANVLCVPANFSAHTGRDHWSPLLRARAIENLCYVVAPAQTGVAPDGFAAYGHTMVVDPWGRVRAHAGRAPGLVLAELSGKAIAERRAALNSPAQIRPDVYARAVRREGGHG